MGAALTLTAGVKEQSNKIRNLPARGNGGGTRQGCSEIFRSHFQIILVHVETIAVVPLAFGRNGG